jgi:hypothetical protein
MIFLLQNQDFTKDNKSKREFNKEKFLNLVDDALIDKQREDELRKILKECSIESQQIKTISSCEE